MSFPIETPRLLIRPFEKTDEDIVAMHALFCDPKVVKYIGGARLSQIRVR